MPGMETECPPGSALSRGFHSGGKMVGGQLTAGCGHVLRGKGYVVQSPVKKESKTETQPKKNSNPESQTLTRKPITDLRFGA